MEQDIDLNIDPEKIRSHEDYMKFWQGLGSVEAKMVEKNEKCRHNLGDVIVYENPYKKPANVCGALMHVVDLYLWRTVLGFPSWNDDRKVYKIHCPDAKGTVWEMRKVSKQP
jgi:uncharacterized repeat protein (TIGR04076 family)